MDKNNSRLDTIISIDQKDYEFISQIKINKIIPDNHKILQEKFRHILLYNEYNLRNLRKRRIYTFEEYFSKNKNEKTLNISSSDITNIKKYLETYSLNNNLALYSLNKFLLLEKERKILLNHLFEHFDKNDKFKLKKEADQLIYIKVYDYYQNELEKDKNLDLLKNILSDEFKYTEKCEVLSIINTYNTHEFLRELISEKRERAEIKYLKHTSASSYISNVFFMLMKYRINGDSTNYRHYLFYFEPETNHSVVGYSDDIPHLKNFYKLLETRFNIQFNNDKSIDFEENLETNDYDKSMEEVFQNINSFLDAKDFDLHIFRDNLFKKVAKLKIQYPKMDLNYKLLNNIVYSVSISKEIELAQRENKTIDNTIRTIEYLFNKKTYSKVKKILYNIVNSKKDNYVKEYDIFKLRRSIYINKIAKTEKALVDIFPNLNWNNLENILNSLNEIKYDNTLLDELLSYFQFDFSDKSFSYKQKQYENKILKEFIYKGKTINLNLQFD